jgi:hypothetical protein
LEPLMPPSKSKVAAELLEESAAFQMEMDQEKK